MEKNLEKNRFICMYHFVMYLKLTQIVNQLYVF